HKEEIREKEIIPGYVSFCYMIAGEDTFDSMWTQECRGIVFSQRTGKVVSRPLHKFFNVNERPSTRADLLKWDDVALVMDKMDGSLISTVITENQVILKSKKAVDSAVAIAAT